MNGIKQSTMAPLLAIALGVPGVAYSDEQAAGSGASTGSSASAGQSSLALEEVVVTAEKRAETAQEVPISLVNLSADDLADRGISSIADLAAHVPSLSMTPFPNSPNSPRLFLRGVGIGESQITSDGAVGVYVDGVYIARGGALGLDVADIERIEVLRGPQGTLFGRNTTGGALSVVTARPTENFGFSQDLSIGDYSYFQSKTVVNVPITKNLLSKFAFNVNERDGIVRNTGVGNDFGAYDKTSGRIDLRWLPTDALTVDYSYDRAENDFTAYYYQLIRPNAAYEGVLPVANGRLDAAALPSPFEDGDAMSEGHTLTLSMDTDWGEFRSISAYRKMDESTYQDYSANSFISVFQNLAPTVDQEQFSQELQLVGSNQEGTIDYAAGLYYFWETGSQFILDRIGLFDLTNPPVDVDATNESYAAYSQVTWRPSAQNPWAFTLGARYTVDDRSADNGVVEPSETFDEFTPSATVAYQVTDAASLYGKVVTGYKSGGFNVRQGVNFDQPYEPENLISYELGWKTEWLDRRLRLNGAVFYAEYDDMQLDLVVPDQPDPGLSQTQNAGEATISGLEIDLDWRVTENLLVSVGYSHLNPTIEEIKGDDKDLWKLPNAPDNQLNARVEWTLARWSGNEFSVSADYTYRESTFGAPRPNPPGEQPGDFIPAYDLTNLRATLYGEDWIGDGTFEVSVWVDNVFDEEYYLEGQGSFYQLTANQEAAFGEPRHYGVDLRYRY